MKQSLIIAVFIGAISASGIKQYSAGYTLPEANICTNANKATTEDESCSTNGNSAWNTITSARTAQPANAMAAPYPAHTEHLQLLQEGYTLPEANICVNTNKATAEDEACSTAGNSAWNTITSSRTAKPSRLWKPHTQLILSIFNLDLRDIPFQTPMPALTPTRPPPRMRLAVPLVTLLGTLSLLLELLSHPRLWMLLIQAMLSTSNWKLPQPPTHAPTPTRPPPRMRLAPLTETPPGTLTPPPEPETQPRPWMLHTQDTPSTERNTRSE